MTIVGKDTTQSRRELWETQIEDVAMEMTQAAYIVCELGNYQIPDEDYECAIGFLKQAFADKYDLVADAFHARLERMTFDHCAIFQDKTPLQMSEDQKQWEQARNDNKTWRADAEDIARRVAHMSVLHWRVWAGLVYLRDETDEMTREEDGEQAFPKAETRSLPSVRGENLAASGIPLGDQATIKEDVGEFF